jgi:hypothetical protein
MKKIIRLTESDLHRIVKRVINENKNPEFLDSFKRRLNFALNFNRDIPFKESPKAIVNFDGKYLNISVQYPNMAKESTGVGIRIKDIIQRTIEEIGEEYDIDFEFISHNLKSYENRDQDFFRYGGVLEFDYKVV